MSKALLLDLIAMNDRDLQDELYRMRNTVSADFRKSLILALKEQDRDTRHACAEQVISGAFWSDTADADVVRANWAHDTIMNCAGGVKNEGLV